MESVFEKAVAFAAKAHAGQKRKGGGGIYLLHPLEDALIVSTMTDDEEVLAAAVLHDTVEDTSVTIEDIEENFGQRVAELVSHETEDKMREMPASESWQMRKEKSLAVLKDGSTQTKMLWLGDKLSNMRSLSKAFDEQGVAVFEIFNEKDPAKQRWYHETILEYTAELSGTNAYKQYEKLVHHVFDELT
ncbi:MAG: bifunctional (p)ppGpp synthetase/guanosine-3',5'-bis(diphosphate) 3'-pyrophosphohydrolase [Clostridia bacterium]|nr:bifunctional (p)ppGpp synthetase/guanosine-3',5'-bis(diphosphate) 3'-pyrophosphohydrolase [Clostridia bacterium]